MDTDKPRWKKRLRKEIKGLAVVLSAYVGIYLFNSFLGGYWLVPERDGRHHYTWGFSVTDAIMWQPRFGHESLGHLDYLGAVFSPMIWFDRALIHPTLYESHENFDQQFKQLKVSQVHPYWRDEFSTEIKVFAVLDEPLGMIRCSLRYTGSEHPREIYTIRLPRKFAEAVAASPPAGFVAKPFEGRETNRNDYSTRWLGKITLTNNQDVIVDIPAIHPHADKGYISFFYQRTDDESPSFKSFSSVDLK